MGQIGLDVIKNNVTNPARTYLWDFEIPSPKGSGTTDVWFIRAQSTVIPGKSFDDIDINYKGTGGFRVPGRERYSHDFPVTVIEGTDKKGFDAIHSWMELVRASVSGEGEPDPDIKADAILTCFDQKGNPWLRIKMVGMYPKNIADIDLNYNASAAILFNVMFSYDRWEELT